MEEQPGEALWGKESGQEDVMDGMVANESICPNLSLKKRLMGFCFCCLVAMFLTAMAVLMLVKKKYTIFAICFSLANIIALSATLFLVGPKKQFKRMLRPTRLTAFIVFVAATVGTIVCAFTIRKVALIIVLCVIQWVAFLWYCLSFVPYARSCVKGCCKSLLGVV
eukprot:TRINITY_DN1803_c0_g1_i6.p1 TRINITY_DN1803_c0_g1~~TRINITY_DN1803_c0_g1_i6.p1  ORF type:complete len:189 (-),score=18.11 TRINITY_DN1803_c0_g1_i6:460-957(-)